jgi:hypothetical protein
VSIIGLLHVLEGRVSGLWFLVSGSLGAVILYWLYLSRKAATAKGAKERKDLRLYFFAALCDCFALFAVKLKKEGFIKLC